jgi:hypothetical protein
MTTASATKTTRAAGTTSSPSTPHAVTGDQEEQQSPRLPGNHQIARPQGGGHFEGGQGHHRDLHELTIVDLRQKINEGRDARDIIDSRHQERGGDFHDIDNSDRFPAFTHNITFRDYPREFKPVGITKYDGK